MFIKTLPFLHAAHRPRKDGGVECQLGAVFTLRSETLEQEWEWGRVRNKGLTCVCFHFFKRTSKMHNANMCSSMLVCTWVFTVSSAQMCVYLGNWNEKALGSLRRTWIFMHGSNFYKAARLWSCGKLKPKPSSGLHGRTGPHCSRLFVSRSFILTRLRPRCVSSHPT